MQAAKVSYVGVDDRGTDTVKTVLGQLTAALDAVGDGVVRVCIPALGAPDWGDLTSTVSLYASRLL